MDIMSDDFTVDLTEDEIAALNPFLGQEEPKTEKVEKVAKDEGVKRVDPEPKRVDQDQSDLLKRVRDAEERAASERAKRIEAERLAHERGTTVAVTSARAAESDFTAVSNALSRAVADSETLKAQHQAALEAGDYAKASDTAAKMAKMEARIASLEDGKASLEDRVKATRTQAETAVKTEAPKTDSSDPFEAFVAGQPPRAASWFRDNPQFAPTSSKKNFAKALAAHHDAIANDIVEGSDDYFAHLNSKLGLAGGDDVDDEIVTEKPANEAPKKAAPKADKPARVAAPVSRDGVVERLADGRFQLRLTAEQARMADELGMSRTAYAKNLAKIQAGSRDPNYSGPRLGQNE